MKCGRLALSVGSLASLLLLAALPLVAQQATPVQATLEQFKRLRWLSGAWQGSGGAYPVFFEDYRVVDDSTIKMRSFKDAALSKVTDSSSIELRNGVVSDRHSGRASVAIELTPSTVHFVPEGATRGGFTFNRQSADLWTATLHSATEGGHETVYLMRRLRQ
jgi:hypothetical protein